jgi:tetratricopeptide (TPR) repeat protein
VISPISSRLTFIVSSDRSRREHVAADFARRWAAARAHTTNLRAPLAQSWPFTYPLTLLLDAAPAIVWIHDVHEAFLNHQTAGTRLVTTQASYVMQAWLDLVGDHDVLLLATADHATLQQHAPEVLARRGLFAHALIHDADEAATTGAASAFARGRSLASFGETSPAASASARLPSPASFGETSLALARAFRAQDPAERLRLCVEALARGRTPAALVATASVCMEVNDLEAAARDLDEALMQAPEWAAAHFERGKLWLRLDDMEHASLSFREAATRMPDFASAWANLGATLGELDRPEEALTAFTEAIRCDPTSHQALNNVGVVYRELGNLAESEAAFRRVIELAPPDLAFGYYNLGHTLFLQGRYQAALAAYLEGQKRDSDRNPVQATRLAMCRLATGDSRGALSDLQRATSGLPRDYRQQLLADTSAIALALLTHRPDLPGWPDVNEWLSGQLTRRM